MAFLSAIGCSRDVGKPTDLPPLNSDLGTAATRILERVLRTIHGERLLIALELAAGSSR